MTISRRLVPVAALVVAIGASAAGAATAAATGDGGATGKGGSTGGADKGKTVSCEMKIEGGTAARPFVKDKLQGGGISAKDGQAVADGTAAKGAGRQPVPGFCDAKPRGVDGLAQIAAKLGVSQDALLKALTDTKQWIGTLGGQVTPEQFDQHVADLLHLPVAKVEAVLGDGPRIGVKNGS